MKHPAVSAGTNRIFTSAALKRLILPLIIEQLLAVTIGMMDTIMVTSVGEAAVSGISLVDSINILLIQIFSALATGGAVIASQYIGRKENCNACSAAKQLVYSSTALSLVIMIFSLVFRNIILRIVFGSIEEDVMRYANTYFWLSALSYPFLAIYNSGAALYRSMGNSRVTMLTAGLMNLVNVIGNSITIYLLGWGVAGAAVATLLSRALGAVIMMYLLRNNGNVIYIEKLFHFEINWPIIKKILKIGIPNGLENGMFQAGKLMVQGVIATLGTAAIAANAIAGSIASLSNIPGAAIGLAMITVVGQCVGANDYKQASYYIKKLMSITYITMIAANLLLFIFAKDLFSLFDLSNDATKMGIDIIYLFTVFSSLMWPMAFTFPNALRAAGDAKFTMYISVFSMLVFRIGFCYLLVKVFNMGLYGVWVAMIIDWFIRTAAFVLRYISGKWKNIKVI